MTDHQAKALALATVANFYRVVIKPYDIRTRVNFSTFGVHLILHVKPRLAIQHEPLAVCPGMGAARVWAMLHNYVVYDGPSGQSIDCPAPST